MHSEFVNATLTDLRRNTTKMIRLVMARRGKVTITKRGQPCIEVVPVSLIDRTAALAPLRAIGLVEFRPRK